MIRVKKSPDAPASLAAKKSYNDEDVLEQLRADQYRKCYICERLCVTDFQVEHHKSKKHFSYLIYEWTNLFWCCSYCNGKKLENYDNTLNPVDTNIECEIKQEIDDLNNKVVFEAIIESPSEQHKETITLLDRVFNGKSRIRTTREIQFYEYVQQEMNVFYGIFQKWLDNPCEETKQPVIEELGIGRELLGLKFWIIKSKREAEEEFKDYIIWNKV